MMALMEKNQFPIFLDFRDAYGISWWWAELLLWEPLNDHLVEYESLMMQNYGLQAVTGTVIEVLRLYDTPKTMVVVTNVY